MPARSSFHVAWVFLSCLTLGCPSGEPPRRGTASESASPRRARLEPTSRPGPPPRVCASLEAGLREGYQTCGRSRLVIEHVGRPAELPAKWVLDLQSGSGHGGTLTSLRFRASGRRVRVEEVRWRGGPRLDNEPRGTARRAVLERSQVSALLELARRLPTLRLTEAWPQRKDGLGRSLWWSFGDFYARLRLGNRGGQTLLARSFVGYPSSQDQLTYLPLRVALAEARRVLGRVLDWTEVPRGDLRETHLAAAFATSAVVLLGRDAGWVRDGFLEALGYFGNPEAVPALRVIGERARLGADQRTKLTSLLDQPEHWLAGHPKELVD